jgi:hypothetical protein
MYICRVNPAKNHTLHRTTDKTWFFFPWRFLPSPDGPQVLTSAWIASGDFDDTLGVLLSYGRVYPWGGVTSGSGIWGRNCGTYLDETLVVIRDDGGNSMLASIVLHVNFESCDLSHHAVKMQASGKKHQASAA